MTRATPYAFFSVKGGVGKSALAVAAAVGFAARGRPVAVLDADLMGTSLADGLALQAPEVSNPRGGVRWRGPARGLLTHAETRERRRAQSFLGRDAGLPYLNGYALGRATRVDPDVIAWRHAEAPAIRWYPSSPSPQDTAAAARAVFGGQPPRFLEGLVRMVHAIGKSLGPDGVLIIDLPPGMYGVPTLFAQELAEETEQLHRLVPVLVCTDDRNDLLRMSEYYRDFRMAFPDAKWVLNRNLRPVEVAREQVKAHLGEAWRVSGLERYLEELGWEDNLAELFKVDRLSVADAGARLVRLLEAK